MADQVTYSKLFSESRNNVVALITSDVSDPTISSAEYRKWIFSRQPDVKDANFKGYPFIIINPADVDIGDKPTVDGKSNEVGWFIEVEIVTSDRGYGKNDGLGLSHMDSISDSVMTTFNNITNRDTLSNNSMKFSRPETTAVTNDIIENELVYRRSIMLYFKSRIQVSA